MTSADRIQPPVEATFLGIHNREDLHFEDRRNAQLSFNALAACMLASSENPAQALISPSIEGIPHTLLSASSAFSFDELPLAARPLFIPHYQHYIVCTEPNTHTFEIVDQTVEQKPFVQAWTALLAGKHLPNYPSEDIPSQETLRGTIYVAFRGSSDPHDWLNSQGQLSVAGGILGQVHSGFLQQSYWCPNLFDLYKAGHRVVLCGHSLGGAVAGISTIALLEACGAFSVNNEEDGLETSDSKSSMRLTARERLRCVTFASPWFCDYKLSETCFSKNLLDYFVNFVICHDPVPFLMTVHQACKEQTEALRILKLTNELSFGAVLSMSELIEKLLPAFMESGGQEVIPPASLNYGNLLLSKWGGLIGLVSQGCLSFAWTLVGQQHTGIVNAYHPLGLFYSIQEQQGERTRSITRVSSPADARKLFQPNDLENRDQEKNLNMLFTLHRLVTYRFTMASSPVAHRIQSSAEYLRILQSYVDFRNNGSFSSYCDDLQACLRRPDFFRGVRYDPNDRIRNAALNDAGITMHSFKPMAFEEAQAVSYSGWIEKQFTEDFRRHFNFLKWQRRFMVFIPHPTEPALHYFAERPEAENFIDASLDKSRPQNWHPNQNVNKRNEDMHRVILISKLVAIVEYERHMGVYGKIVDTRDQDEHLIRYLYGRRSNGEPDYWKLRFPSKLERDRWIRLLTVAAKGRIQLCQSIVHIKDEEIRQYARICVRPSHIEYEPLSPQSEKRLSDLSDSQHQLSDDTASATTPTQSNRPGQDDDDGERIEEHEDQQSNDLSSLQNFSRFHNGFVRRSKDIFSS